MNVTLYLHENFDHILPYDAYAQRRLCRGKMSVCLSVRLSHAGIESKRLYISSKFFHRRVAPPF